jgi:hypothetical protein
MKIGFFAYRFMRKLPVLLEDLLADDDEKREEKDLSVKVNPESVQNNKPAIHYQGNSSLEKTMYMRVKHFKTNFYSQELLFLKAKQTLSDVNKRFGRLLERFPVPVNMKALLKADSPEDMTKAIVLKSSERGYRDVNEVRDLVRGRIDLELEEQVTEEQVAIVVRALQDLSNTFGFQIKEMVLPRNPILDPKTQKPIPGMFGYPRIHVVIEVDGFLFEFQVGLSVVTFLYEKNGIPIPEGLSLKNNMHNNLHDIAYKFFSKVLAKAVNCPKHAEIVRDTQMREFMQGLAISVAETGLYGKQYIYANDKFHHLYQLHREAGNILLKIVEAIQKEEDHPMKQTLLSASFDLNGIALGQRPSF